MAKAIRSRRTKIKPFEPETLPNWEQLVKAIKDAELYLNFAKNYLHNGHLKGAVDALKSIKNSATKGLKVKKGGSNE
ncbi:hypothetical protein L5B71_02775 [Avibacterium sp. 21-586]|uniref:hypothetical protein n=1 Tax=Avibacterium sp. 21-586 TaxID=2911534 RepID=UPI002245E047|nr:hypothetical protein [Avibacterium sp. 21-586]MCW9709815.1 hypothetical protein [Avibacterium sp. 21-586]